MIFFYQQDEDGWSPLHAALYLKSYKTAEFLLSHGANLNAQDKHGMTPVMAFVLSRESVEKNSMDMWHLMMSSGIDFTLTDKVSTLLFIYLVLTILLSSAHVSIIAALYGDEARPRTVENYAWR